MTTFRSDLVRHQRDRYLTTDPREYDDELDPEIVAALVERHRDEYDRLVDLWEYERKIAGLTAQVERLDRALETERQRNPNGADVPALAETANRLAKTNLLLHRRLAKHHERPLDGQMVGQPCPICEEVDREAAHSDRSS